MVEIPRRGFVALAAIAPVMAGADMRVFSAEDARWVEAIQARIIPTDDAPGAREAGCLAYLDRQLGEGLKRFVPAYRKGLGGFQSTHPRFLELDAAAQDAVLESLGRDPFFEMLIDHTMQGFYGSPEHGGNRAMASWKMLGIDKHMGEGHWHGA